MAENLRLRHFCLLEWPLFLIMSPSCLLPNRRPAMAENLRLRHRIVRCIRRFLEDEHGFMEVRAERFVKMC